MLPTLLTYTSTHPDRYATHFAHLWHPTIKSPVVDSLSMRDNTPLELIPEKDQIKRLRDFLHPRRSRMRPFLGLFAIRNYLLRQAGPAEKNVPTVQWYQRHVIRAGVPASHWNVRYQLNWLAKSGVLDKATAYQRVSRTNETFPGLVDAKVCEYRLNAAIYPALEQALKQLLGVESFRGLAALDRGDR